MTSCHEPWPCTMSLHVMASCHRMWFRTTSIWDGLVFTRSYSTLYYNFWVSFAESLIFGYLLLNPLFL